MAIVKFEHGEIGLTRFPPNVEQITVRWESGAIWLIARRNETELRFPLSEDDCQHLAALLLRQVRKTRAFYIKHGNGPEVGPSSP